MNLIKIKDSPLMRDIESNAILNINSKEIEEYNSRRKKLLDEKNEKEETKKRLAKLESDIGEIKMLLIEISKIRSENAN